MKDKKTVAQVLGDNLKRIRQEKGVSRKDLAEKLNVSPNTIASYENGIKTPLLEKVFLLAEFLNVPIAALTGDNQNLIDQKIFEYRLQRAFTMARDFMDSLLNAEPVFDKEGRIVICSPKKIKIDKNSVIHYADGYNSITFKTAEDFVKVMEQAEKDALQRQVHFNLAFRHIVFGDEFYRVIDD